MPLVGSCSLAIGAVFHLGQHSRAGGASLPKQKLQWSVVSTSVDGIPHCGFSNKGVEAVVKVRMYACEHLVNQIRANNEIDSILERCENV
jgi:hypothetical protein